MKTRAVTIVDYGSGNLLSVARALEASGAEVDLVDDPDSVGKADRLILPGVGAFGDCVQSLRSRRLDLPVLKFIETGRPLLGLCVGMQMLFQRSFEFGEHTGLGILPGEVRPIPKVTVGALPQKIPHIGWSSLFSPPAADRDWSETILSGLAQGVEVYFVHSFTAWPETATHRIADAQHGGQRIAAAVGKDNVYGTQFHPEKSGPAGLKILENFIRL